MTFTVVGTTYVNLTDIYSTRTARTVQTIKNFGTFRHESARLCMVISSQCGSYSKWLLFDIIPNHYVYLAFDAQNLKTILDGI